MLKLAFLGLHDCMLLFHEVISIINKALLLQFVLLFHLGHPLIVLNLLHQVLLISFVVILALKMFSLHGIADLVFSSLLVLREHCSDTIVFLLFTLRETVQSATVFVLARDGFLSCNAILHTLHVIVLILHEWRHSRVQVMNLLAAIFEVLDL